MQGSALIAHPATAPRDRTGGDRLRAKVLLGFLVATGLPIGIWEQYWPRSFYDGFPGFGRGWVAVDGPYNEHLVRDVGGGTLALTVIALLALVWTTPALVRAVAVGVLVAQVPHLAYHLVHAELLPATGDRVVNGVGLASTVVVPLLLLLGASRLETPAPDRLAAPALRPFVDQQTVLLTSYRRDGRRVGTPVHIAVDGDRAVFRTWDTTGKLKRIRRTPGVTIAPSTGRGRPTGPALHARARILTGEESAAAGRTLARKYPVLHGVLIPLVHRLRRNTTVHVALTPVGSGPPDADTERHRQKPTAKRELSSSDRPDRFWAPFALPPSSRRRRDLSQAALPWRDPLCFGMTGGRDAACGGDGPGAPGSCHQRRRTGVPWAVGPHGRLPPALVGRPLSNLGRFPCPSRTPSPTPIASCSTRWRDGSPARCPPSS